MAAPTIGARTPPLSAGGDLVAEQCGPHVLIRRRDEKATDAVALAEIPRMPGNALVLASAGAHRHEGLLFALQGCVATLRSRRGEVPLRSVWLAVSNLGNPSGRYVSWLHGLSVEFGMEIVAPHGSLIAGRGIGLYVDRAEGGAGWRCFSPGSSGKALSCRFPMPAWEYQLPDVPLMGAGLVTEPVPAGLAVRLAGSAPLDLHAPQFQVPLNLRIPKLVVGEPGAEFSPRAVAQIIDRLPEPVWGELLVVPLLAPVTTANWARELAVALNRDIAVTTGTQVVTAKGSLRTLVRAENGDELLEPLATILRHSPYGAQPEVCDIVPPPAGWQQAGPRHYRPMPPSEAASAGLIAEVLPGGLHVRRDTDRTRVTAAFDPRRWTLVVGDEHRDVTEPEIFAICDLLESLGQVRCRTVDLHVLGSSWQYALDGFEAHLRALGVRLDTHAEQTHVRVLDSSGAPSSWYAHTPLLASGARFRSSAPSPNHVAPRRAPMRAPAPTASETTVRFTPVSVDPAVPPPVAAAPVEVSTRLAPMPSASFGDLAGERSHGSGTPAASDRNGGDRLRPAAATVPRREALGPAVPGLEPAAAPMSSASVDGADGTGPELAASPTSGAVPTPPVPVTAMPIATVSGPRPESPVATPRPEPVLAPVPQPEPEPSAAPVPPAGEHVGAAEALIDLEPEPVRPVRSAASIELADRASTPAEQTRLSLSAGSDYTEALAAVNVALSAWPMLKPEAKADYVAVCLYLGRGAAGGVALNDALGTGGPEPFDGYLPCLVSGLRRLPTHRKVVLRQESLHGTADCPYPEGSILHEPGFLSASAQLDVTTAAANLDLLIWPVSARRTSELLMGRALEETVFPANRRFKALAARAYQPEDDDAPHAPRRALLVRELLAGEDPESPEALARDAAALPRLERAWEQRRRG
ncbi:MAG: hypothetical protein QOF58_322, partial [Pseudonocardiales bacterium]|nr:hypothetical protein [Pseudonocardiales bacterium]